MEGLSVVACQWLAKMAAELDSEEVGEEHGPVLEAEEGLDKGYALEAEMGPGQSGSHQLPSESNRSEAGEQLEPVPSLRMRRAAKSKEQLGTKGQRGSKATGGWKQFIRCNGVKIYLCISETVPSPPSPSLSDCLWVQSACDASGPRATTRCSSRRPYTISVKRLYNLFLKPSSVGAPTTGGMLIGGPPLLSDNTDNTAIMSPLALRSRSRESVRGGGGAHHEPQEEGSPLSEFGTPPQLPQPQSWPKFCPAKEEEEVDWGDDLSHQSVGGGSQLLPTNFLFFFFFIFPTSTLPWLPCFVSLEHISGFLFYFSSLHLFRTIRMDQSAAREFQAVFTMDKKCAREEGAQKAVLGETQEWGVTLPCFSAASTAPLFPTILGGGGLFPISPLYPVSTLGSLGKRSRLTFSSITPHSENSKVQANCSFCWRFEPTRKTEIALHFSDASDNRKSTLEL
ncbi:hypothetical protein L345_03410, partial [Ophiophagus hannah]